MKNKGADQTGSDCLLKVEQVMASNNSDYDPLVLAYLSLPFLSASHTLFASYLCSFSCHKLMLLILVQSGPRTHLKSFNGRNPSMRL